MSAVENVPVTTSEQEDADPFADVAGHALQALREAVADRRRKGLTITVDRGHGIERIS
jgi:hypothetical protein